jgi:hypothetical protein
MMRLQIILSRAASRRNSPGISPVRFKSLLNNPNGEFNLLCYSIFDNLDSGTFEDNKAGTIPVGQAGLNYARKSLSVIY